MSEQSGKVIRVAVCGATGKMGSEVVKTVLRESALALVGAVDLNRVGEDAGTVVGAGEVAHVAIEADLKAMLQRVKPQVCVDFTHPSQVFGNTMALIEAGCCPVVGTTGLSPEQLGQIESALKLKGIGGMVIPNFAIGAVLMMKFAAQAAKYFDHAEIIELHHNRKADAPSGTAIKTAELMSEALQQAGKNAFIASEVPEKESYAGARGAIVGSNIHVHSVRLPGYVAHQEVLLSGPGQILTLRHDSMDRQSFMPGVALAIKAVINRPGLTYGLEHILD